MKRPDCKTPGCTEGNVCFNCFTGGVPLAPHSEDKGCQAAGAHRKQEDERFERYLDHQAGRGNREAW